MAMEELESSDSKVLFTSQEIFKAVILCKNLETKPCQTQSRFGWNSSMKHLDDPGSCEDHSVGCMFLNTKQMTMLGVWGSTVLLEEWALSWDVKQNSYPFAVNLSILVSAQLHSAYLHFQWIQCSSFLALSSSVMLLCAIKRAATCQQWVTRAFTSFTRVLWTLVN